jgi:hypothetical protein
MSQALLFLLCGEEIQPHPAKYRTAKQPIFIPKTVKLVLLPRQSRGMSSCIFFVGSSPAFARCDVRREHGERA